MAASKKKVAIVGFSENSRDLAPYDDDSFEIWGCNHLYRLIPRVDVVFELHHHGELEAKYGDNWPEYRQWLMTTKEQIYMLEKQPDFPTSVRYPIEDVVEFLSSFQQKRPDEELEPPYFASTIGYMFMLALMQGKKEIGLYGVDMVIDSEYGVQRPNTEYMIGLARGRGVKVVIPKESALLKGRKLYAYEHETWKYADTITAMRKRIEGMSEKFNEAEQRANKALDTMHVWEGARGWAKEFKQAITDNGHGKPEVIEMLDKQIELLNQRFKEMEEVNAKAVDEMHNYEGARWEAMYWIDKFGYNDRGEPM